VLTIGRECDNGTIKDNIGTISPGASVPLRWKIHFVKSGRSSFAVLAEVRGFTVPVAGEITTFTVAPKRNLNPGAVLPVALGVPVVLILFLFIPNAARKRDE